MKNHKLSALLLALFVCAMFSATSTASWDTSMEGGGVIGPGESYGYHGVLNKECTDSAYYITVTKGQSLKAWAESLVFWPSFGTGFNTLNYRYECSQEQFDSVETGDWIDCTAAMDKNSPSGKLLKIDDNKGPMLYNAEGLLCYLYHPPVYFSAIPS